MAVKMATSATQQPVRERIENPLRTRVTQKGRDRAVTLYTAAGWLALFFPASLAVKPRGKIESWRSRAREFYRKSIIIIVVDLVRAMGLCVSQDWFCIDEMRRVDANIDRSLSGELEEKYGKSRWDIYMPVCVCVKRVICLLSVRWWTLQWNNFVLRCKKYTYIGELFSKKIFVLYRGALFYIQANSLICAFSERKRKLGRRVEAMAVCIPV